jgi:hypothetical protein
MTVNFTVTPVMSDRQAVAFAGAPLNEFPLSSDLSLCCPPFRCGGGAYSACDRLSRSGLMTDVDLERPVLAGDLSPRHSAALQHAIEWLRLAVEDQQDFIADRELVERLERALERLRWLKLATVDDLRHGNSAGTSACVLRRPAARTGRMSARAGRGGTARALRAG